MACLTYLIFWGAWRRLSRVLSAVLRRTSLDATAVRFIQTVAKVIVPTVGLRAALGRVGIDTASLLTSLGVAGLTIGFAAKDALSNVISGLFIFWDRPFVIGDLVEVDGRYGRFETIPMRSTRVVTPDGKMLAIPNSTVVNSTVTSYSNFPHLRLDVPVTVGTREDLSEVRRPLLGIVGDAPAYMPEPAPAVVVTQLDDHNVEVEVRAWIDDEQRHVQERHALRERIFETLTAAGVDMPCETLRLEPFELKTGAAGPAAA